MTLLPGGRYVALGSSFAAGPLLGSRVMGSPRAAGRSGENYAHVLARRAGLELVDVTYSGATTADLLQASPERPVPQIEAVSREARLVTITCGGNDVGYLPMLTLSSLPWPLQTREHVQSRLWAMTDPASLDRNFAQLEDQLVHLVEEVKRRAPRAEIAVVDYLTVLPPDAATPTGILPAHAADWGRPVAQRLTSVFETVAAGQGVRFVPVGAHSVDHHAWSAEPWTNRFRFWPHAGAPYHPNRQGMRAVADLLLDQL